MKCKICSEESPLVFTMPASRQTGDPQSLLNDGPKASFYECEGCQFLFSDVLDKKEQFYETEFKYNFEPGADLQYMRLLSMAAITLEKPLNECRVLDFGSGDGEFVRRARFFCDIEIFGFDLGAREASYVLSNLEGERFDIVLAREVVEHFIDPLSSFAAMKAALKPRGVIAFQTALYIPGVCGREWEYIGPNNGHISLYSAKALKVLQQKLGVDKIAIWKNYDSIAAWRIVNEPAADTAQTIPLSQFRYPDPAILKHDLVEFSKSESAENTVLYGPYMVMDKGRYRIDLTGQVTGIFNVVIADHTGEVHVQKLSQAPAQIIFDQPRNTWAWELIIQVEGGSEYLRIDDIVLVSLHEKETSRKIRARESLRRNQRPKARRIADVLGGLGIYRG